MKQHSKTAKIQLNARKATINIDPALAFLAVASLASAASVVAFAAYFSCIAMRQLRHKCTQRLCVTCITLTDGN